MASKRLFRFSVQAMNAVSASDWRHKARHAESLGYSTLNVADHYLGPGPALDSSNHPMQGLASIPALAAAAEATSSLKIGSRVFCTGYRPAPILVKEAMTLDFLSGGRFELGLGAGWLKCEYDAMGIPFPAAGERISRLEETIALAKSAMRGEMLNHSGSYVKAVGYKAEPVPARGKVPLLIGGGSRRILGVAGREADIVSLNFDNRSGVIDRQSLVGSTEAQLHEKIEWVKAGGKQRFAEIELEIGIVAVAVGDEGRSIAESWAKRLDVSIEQLRGWPHALIGSVDTICDDIQRLREQYGISYFNVQDSSSDLFAPVVARLYGR
jgi:probable F420-dependent oxidoreductase